ncbi:MAG: hypothetical protein KC619_17665 [Myxococcales bacterium]|nr:hypothetical protein [Myxococcales bacterium]
MDEDEPPEDLAEEEEEEAPPGRFRQWLGRNRTRLSQLALGLFLVAVLIEVGGALPRDVEVAFRFPDHARVVEARVEYLQEEESVREIILRFREGAPALVRDTVSLSPGDYDVSVLLLDSGGARHHLRGRLTAPADGVVRVRLRE